jgi:hypothetical protein
MLPKPICLKECIMLFGIHWKKIWLAILETLSGPSFRTIQSGGFDQELFL